MPLDIADDLQKAAAAKSINDYLNHYITVIDTKAGAFLAGNVAAASLLVHEWPADTVGRAAAALTITLFAASTLVAGGVIYPRRPGCGGSVIFWGDIASAPDSATYIRRFNEVIERGQLDEQYSFQNYCTSQVLRRKFRWLRGAIVLFFLALIAGFFTYLWAPPVS
ncbi:MAG: hypothetical protein JNG86_09350 [Verrucomicrobiaceae bacterium]|nr:hypothetical protein [Verrucomicrobiaceae bacterium]